MISMMNVDQHYDHPEPVCPVHIATCFRERLRRVQEDSTARVLSRFCDIPKMAATKGNGGVVERIKGDELEGVESSGKAREGA